MHMVEKLLKKGAEKRHFNKQMEFREEVYFRLYKKAPW